MRHTASRCGKYIVILKLYIASLHTLDYIVVYRGDEFRPEFTHLGEIRSVLPSHVHIMATTATATDSTFVMIQNKSRLTVVSRAAKESRIKSREYKNATPTVSYLH